MRALILLCGEKPASQSLSIVDTEKDTSLDANRILSLLNVMDRTDENQFLLLPRVVKHRVQD